MSGNDKIIVDAAIEKDGRKTLTCPQAFKIAQEHNIPLKEIGDLCDRNDVKIISCQIGCFK